MSLTRQGLLVLVACCSLGDRSEESVPKGLHHALGLVASIEKLVKFACLSGLCQDYFSNGLDNP